MNNKIIQSIHHEHGENILNGVKRYEIRKTAPKSGSFPYIIYLYETERPYRGADNTLHPGAGAVIGFYICKAIIKTNAFRRSSLQKQHARGGGNKKSNSIHGVFNRKATYRVRRRQRHFRLCSEQPYTLSETSPALGLRLNTRSAELAIFEVNKKGLSSRKLDKPRSAFVLPINYIYKYSTTAAKSQ